MTTPTPAPSSAAATKVVIVDGQLYNWNDDFAVERAHWEPLGIQLSVTGCKTEDELIAAGAEADILVYPGLYTPFTAEVLRQMPRCRMITRYGIGMDSVDLEAATRLNIVVVNAAEYCVPEVADHASALILALARRVPFLDRSLRADGWDADRERFGPLRRLSTQTLGLVGFGRIARLVAKKMAPFFGTLLAHDPYVQQERAVAYGVQLVALDQLLERADFVSIHAPLLSATRCLIGLAQLERMKTSAFLINTSRGPVVDESALIKALETGTIAGAALDVFEEEPLSLQSPLRTFENVVITPHSAAYSTHAIEDLRASVARTVADVARGLWPPFVMNPEVQPWIPLQPRESSRD